MAGLNDSKRRILQKLKLIRITSVFVSLSAPPTIWVRVSSLGFAFCLFSDLILASFSCLAFFCTTQISSEKFTVNKWFVNGFGSMNIIRIILSLESWSKLVHYNNWNPLTASSSRFCPFWARNLLNILIIMLLGPSHSICNNHNSV